MVKERAEWEKYRDHLVREVKDFEKAKAAFVEEKAKFESDRKSEEWGREGLRSKLRAAEELLSKERTEWKEVCKKDNQRMFAARSKITDLEAQNATLTKKVEDVEADKERVEAELKVQVASRDKDLHAKDVEIAELKRRLHEQTDKSESLEIDLEAERVKAAIAEEAKQKAEEARDISTSTLNIAQNNYSEAQAIVDTLMANSILNSSELDAAVAALIDASRVVGHCGGYLERAQHVEEALGQEFDVKALKHDDWCQRLKTILDPLETVELSGEEEPAGGDGDGDGYEYVIVLIGVVPFTITALLLETLVKLARINVSVALV
ncbi:myosin-6-like [Helianthus annuus]|uniref:myosin-6-like n=1 Tax=Helianthus annuus TaxID=4232 RepID=UPI000B8F2C81|nr:myosin-6-like [Helianthus annuus]